MDFILSGNKVVDTGEEHFKGERFCYISVGSDTVSGYFVVLQIVGRSRMTPIAEVREFSLILRQSSIPDIPGMTMSVSTRSGCSLIA